MTSSSRKRCDSTNPDKRLASSGPISFTDIEFVCLWLPCAIAFFAVVRRAKAGASAFALSSLSLVFAWFAGWLSVVVLAAAVVSNYGMALLILRLPAQSVGRRLVTTAAIVANLLPLAAFKLAQQTGWAFSDGGTVSAADVVVPVGLAFYSLQQISFIVDVQRADTPLLSFPRYAAWATFFGQLLAGPIATYRRMAPQYASLGDRPMGSADFARGSTLILAGVIKKTWLADPLARKIDAIALGAQVSGITPVEAWTASWGFLLQLYFDFSAYSDIAIGVGLCFGLRLPANFNSPLKASTPSEYISRWHISLMLFVRDYVFEPLFRLGRKLPIKPTSRRYGCAWALSTLGGYLAVAAWHTFAPLVLVQGLLVTSVIVAYQFLRLHKRPVGPQSHHMWRASRKHLGHLFLLMAASITAICLREGANGHIGQIVSALFDLPRMADAVRGIIGGQAEMFPNARLDGLRTMGALALITIIVLVSPNTMQMFGVVNADEVPRWLIWRPNFRWGWMTIVLLMIALMGMTRPIQPFNFIYAQL